MTIEELAKLKRHDRVLWNNEVVRIRELRVLVTSERTGGKIVDLDALEAIPGPTLPPHVAEIWEWDGEPKKNGDIEGWVWDDGWPHPLYTFSYQWACPLYRLVSKIRKESK